MERAARQPLRRWGARGALPRQTSPARCKACLADVNAWRPARGTAGRVDALPPVKDDDQNRSAEAAPRLASARVPPRGCHSLALPCSQVRAALERGNIREGRAQKNGGAGACRAKMRGGWSAPEACGLGAVVGNY